GGPWNLLARRGGGHAPRHKGDVLRHPHPLAAGPVARVSELDRGLQPAGLPGQCLQGLDPGRRAARRPFDPLLRALLGGPLRRRLRAVRPAQAQVRGSPV
ncbi:hypothetical protein AVDCRST_MAG82-1469, partial [uncultured Rubrobacteraceae bacterium]